MKDNENLKKAPKIDHWHTHTESALYGGGDLVEVFIAKCPTCGRVICDEDSKHGVDVCYIIKENCSCPECGTEFDWIEGIRHENEEDDDDELSEEEYHEKYWGREYN